MIYTFKAEFLIDDEEVFTDEKLEEILQYLLDSTSCDIKNVQILQIRGVDD